VAAVPETAGTLVQPKGCRSGWGQEGAAGALEGAQTTHKILIAVVSMAALVLLAACGESPGCRAVTGGGIGAAGGAVVGALAGHPAVGALVGGAGGAAAGGLTSPNQVYLGSAPCD
jgi:osmotically inducible lipoprotein OsmB